MKVGIISKYYKNYNYGGLLQAYALVEILKKIGLDAQQISFLPNERKKYGNNRYVVLVLKFAIKSIFLHCKCLRLRSFNKKMIEFMNDIPHSIVVNSENIDKLNSCYDVFIAGSDQIWNPAFSYDEYFLDFVDKSKKKISYAASIGVSDCNEDELLYLKKRINNIDCVSVREYEGKRILDYILPNKKIYWVLDPTFLLNKSDWDTLDVFESMNLPEKYAVVYLMGNNIENKLLVESIIKSLNIDMIVIPFTMSDFIKNKNVRYDLGPKEFVTLIKHAEVVFTDSFHATSFSIINNKNFYCLSRSNSNKEKSMNSRIDSLFQMFAIESRWISSFNDYKLISTDIDYTLVEKKIEESRKSSIEFLKEALDI